MLSSFFIGCNVKFGLNWLISKKKKKKKYDKTEKKINWQGGSWKKC